MTSLLPIETASVSDLAFHRLVEAITSGDYAPGQKLSEAGLAAELGISRVPLREALGRLEGRLVTRTPRLGVSVIELGRQVLEQLYFVREGLEGMAARLAAENASDAELLAFRDALALETARHRRRVSKPYLASEDEDFHFRIIRAAKCEQLERVLLETVYYQLRIHRARAKVDPVRARAAMSEHRTVADALSARDPDGAERAMRDHIRLSRLNLMQRFAREDGPSVERPSGPADGLSAHGGGASRRRTVG